MHSRQTVIYICEEYPSGNRYYYKKELITHDSWMNPKSLEWSAPRPISEKTFIERARAGYRMSIAKSISRRRRFIRFLVRSIVVTLIFRI